jgi:Spy/CpxP family protein refolding chaperone
MKTKILFAAILVLATSFGAFAQDAAQDMNPPARQQAAQWPMPL